MVKQITQIHGSVFQRYTLFIQKTYKTYRDVLSSLGMSGQFNFNLDTVILKLTLYELTLHKHLNKYLFKHLCETGASYTAN